MLIKIICVLFSMLVPFRSIFSRLPVTFVLITIFRSGESLTNIPHIYFVWVFSELILFAGYRRKIILLDNLSKRKQIEAATIIPF
eukprot:gene4712-3404_t